MSSIEGGTVLITGGASGIGFLMGRLVLERGAARLVIWDMQADALAEAEAALRAPGRSVVGFAVDITDPEQVRRALAAMDRAGVFGWRHASRGAGEQPDGGGHTGGDDNPGMTFGDLDHQADDAEHDEDFNDGAGPHGSSFHAGCRTHALRFPPLGWSQDPARGLFGAAASPAIAVAG